MDIKGFSGRLEVKIFTVAGRLIRKIHTQGPFYPGKNRVKIEAAELLSMANGTYIYEVSLYSGTTAIKRKDIMIIIR